MIPKKHHSQINRLITQALQEDVGRGDITTQLLVSKKQISKAALVVRENAVIFGLEIVRRVFQKLDRNIRMQINYHDGQSVPANSVVAILEGKTHALLTAERVALNFFSRLSGIATLTSRYVQAIRPFTTKIFDTRKTTPTLRILERLAVHAAGGGNHRFNLNDMILIKDNHRVACQSKISLQKIITHAKKKTKRPIEIEVDSLEDLEVALLSKPDFILLDNMSASQLRAAVRLKKTLRISGKPFLEASGGVTLKNIQTIAQTGIDRISVGALTHSPQAVNVALEFLS